MTLAELTEYFRGLSELYADLDRHRRLRVLQKRPWVEDDHEYMDTAEGCALVSNLLAQQQSGAYA